MPSMPEPVADDQDSSHPEDIILGVDTHKDLHVAAVITSLGALQETTTFPASAAGYQALLAWAGTFGVLRRPRRGMHRPLTVQHWPGICGRAASR
jgi:transposase